ncbi:alpha/beta-hydrolase [Bimuria novae-zelandiae CBS 107.79]|uniref:Alpha/beta-hydrolase n=1 Tax=Bimuria novae-zelandiae CBS 107.79 TaxID=1447943 RepID=A0A6A5V295_9PLEO|nr:alpha/beta-hydrolase [Bimuria novae-zelandiae CBS 107.79]
MADQQQKTISFSNRVGIASTTLNAMLAATARLWTSPFKGQNGANNYYKDVIYAMMRTSLSNLNLEQERYTRVPTTEAYITFCKSNGMTPDSVTLGSGTQAHWLGNKDAKRVLLWFHGGGYVMAGLAGHFQYLVDMKDMLNAQGSDTAVLVLAYGLAPENKYPTQLTQAVECLRYLLHKTDRIPSDISIGGDSAGGNLAIGLLSHLAHPHPEIPALHLPTKLHAALLLSPWCSFNTHTRTYETNAEKDCFDGRTLERWSSAFLGSDSPFAGDFYSEPVTAPAYWWEGTASVIEEVLIWGGGDEIMRDGIEEFAQRFTKGFGKQGGRVNSVITPRAAHMEMILELLLGYKGDSGTGSAKVVQDWARAKLPIQRNSTCEHTTVQLQLYDTTSEDFIACIKYLLHGFQSLCAENPTSKKSPWHVQAWAGSQSNTTGQGMTTDPIAKDACDAINIFGHDGSEKASCDGGIVTCPRAYGQHRCTRGRPSDDGESSVSNPGSDRDEKSDSGSESGSDDDDPDSGRGGHGSANKNPEDGSDEGEDEDDGHSTRKKDEDKRDVNGKKNSQERREQR